MKTKCENVGKKKSISALFLLLMTVKKLLLMEEHLNTQNGKVVQ